MLAIHDQLSALPGGALDASSTRRDRWYANRGSRLLAALDNQAGPRLPDSRGRGTRGTRGQQAIQRLQTRETMCITLAMSGENAMREAGPVTLLARDSE